MDNPIFDELKGNGELDVSSYKDIRRAIAFAILSAERKNRTVWFRFDGVIVTVAADSRLELLMRDWHRAIKGCISRNVGPYPKPELTADDYVADIAVENLRSGAQADELRASRSTTAALQAFIDACMIGTPEMEFANPDARKKFGTERRREPVGAHVVATAEYWARLMQMGMRAGSSLLEILAPAFHAADHFNLSRDGMRRATQLLIRHWAHGAELSQLFRYEV